MEKISSRKQQCVCVCHCLCARERPPVCFDRDSYRPCVAVKTVALVIFSASATLCISAILFSGAHVYKQFYLNARVWLLYYMDLCSGVLPPRSATVLLANTLVRRCFPPVCCGVWSSQALRFGPTGYGSSYISLLSGRRGQAVVFFWRRHDHPSIHIPSSLLSLQNTATTSADGPTRSFLTCRMPPTRTICQRHLHPHLEPHCYFIIVFFKKTIFRDKAERKYLLYKAHRRCHGHCSSSVAVTMGRRARRRRTTATGALGKARRQTLSNNSNNSMMVLALQSTSALTMEAGRQTAATSSTGRRRRCKAAAAEGIRCSSSKSTASSSKWYTLLQCGWGNSSLHTR